MFDLNATLLIFVISFLIFMALLNEVFLKPVGKVIEARANKVKADIEAGKAARLKAQESITEYERHLHDIRSKAQAVINEASEKSTYHRNLEVNRLREEGHRKLEATRAEIAAERNSLLEQLVNQEAQLVQEIGRRVIGEEIVVPLDTDKVRRALEEAS
jgi:F-type H+-transporting ATPase subunit b